MNFTPFPQLTTERIILRQLENSDNHTILFLRSDEAVNKYLNRPRSETIEEADAFIQKIKTVVLNNESIYWCITLKETNEMIGTVSLWQFSEDGKAAEVGYDLKPSFHGKGIMTEVISAVLDYAFNKLNLDNIKAFTHNENVASKKVLVKNKFSLTENRKDPENENGVIFKIERNIHLK